MQLTSAALGIQADLGTSSWVFYTLDKSNNWLTVVEFDFRVVGDGRSATARYANNSNYRNDSLIRKESTNPTQPPPRPSR